MMPAHAWLSEGETQALARAFPGGTLRFVGGCVRDALLARPVTDIDAATLLTPEQVMALLAQKNIRAIPTGIDHGTVTAIIGHRKFEITTLRRDVATHGRHATVEYTDDWQEDARRRDFTMNALYLSPEGELFDYFSGEDDARAGRVMFIGDPRQRIAEDYLRILRFFRFWAHYGKTPPDTAALDACAEAAHKLERLSAERIQQEMLKLLAAAKSHPAIKLMIERGIFSHVFGYTPAASDALARLEEIAALLAQPARSATKLLALLLPAQAAPEALALRWKLSGALATEMENLAEAAAAISPGLPQALQKKYIRQYKNEGFIQAVMLAWAMEEAAIEKTHAYADMLELAGKWQAPQLPVSGKDLLARGVAEGARLGEILRELEALWEAGDYQATKDELLARVKP